MSRVRQPGAQRLGTKALGALSLGLAAVSLAACGTGQTPFESTQWQVTDIYSGPDRPTLLPPSNQSRTHLVFGETSFTGQVGCYTIGGPLTWGGTEDARTVAIASEGNNGTAYSDEDDTGTSCLPSDQDTAQRLVNVLAGREFKLSRPEDNALRLEATDEGLQDWQTAPSVSMISGPKDSDDSQEKDS